MRSDVEGLTAIVLLLLGATAVLFHTVYRMGYEAGAKDCAGSKVVVETRADGSQVVTKAKEVSNEK